MRTPLRCVGVLLISVALAAACSSSSSSGRAAPNPTAPTTSTPAASTPANGGVQLIAASGSTQPPPNAAELRAAAQGEEQFAVALYRELAAGKGNVAIAPSSVATVLGMIAAGARGATAQQVVRALHVLLPDARLHAAIGGLAQGFADRTGKGVTLAEVDQAWLQTSLSILAPYSDTLAGSYGAPLATIDFQDPAAAAATINKWFGDHTNGKITNLLTADALQSAALVLTDAVYLDAQWAHGFDPKLTAPAPFHLADGTTANVPTMHLNDVKESDPAPLGYASGAGWQAVALPYMGGQLEMDVIAPSDLASFEASLDPTELAGVLGAFRPTHVVLSMPRFDASIKTDLVQPLQALGIRDAFSTANADLSGIDGKRDLYVSDVTHEVVVHVDERGTVAAGSTAGVIAPLAAESSTVVQVDKPFLYVVRDRTTGAILFFGRVSDPRS